MQPTDCPRCQRLFEARPMLQAEARHVAATEGAGMGRFIVDEALASDHAEHFGGSDG